MPSRAHCVAMNFLTASAEVEKRKVACGIATLSHIPFKAADPRPLITSRAKPVPWRIGSR
jgi:hypothetical protein